MKITVEARHMDVTGAMRDYVESKVAKLPRYYDSIQSIETVLDLEADQAVVEMVVTARRKSVFVATHREEDMYASVDQCLRKMTEQLRRHKDRVRDHQGPPHSQTMAGEGS